MSLFQTKERDGSVYILAGGYVTKDPKVFEKSILFSVCYAKQKYINVKVWLHDDDVLSDIAKLLERHDRVLVSGKYETYRTTTGDERNQIVADYINVATVPSAAPSGKMEDGAEQPVTDKPDNSPAQIPEGFTEEEDDGELPF